MEKSCPICGGLLVESKVRIAIAESPVGNFPGYRCSNCGEEFLAERSIQSAHEEILRAGLFGVLRRTPAVNPVLTIPFTILKTGTGGQAPVSQSALILEVEATAPASTVMNGHTPSA
jgi:hypothetical protein